MLGCGASNVAREDVVGHEVPEGHGATSGAHASIFFHSSLSEVAILEAKVFPRDADFSPAARRVVHFADVIHQRGGVRQLAEDALLDAQAPTRLPAREHQDEVQRVEGRVELRNVVGTGKLGKLGSR